MSFLELGATMFRGELKAATGVVKFHLSAAAIDAVDTLNIAGGSVSYSQFFTFSLPATSGQVFGRYNANIQDDEAFLEVVVYSNRLANVYVSGVLQNRHNANRNLSIFPVIVVVPLPRGIHEVALTANSSGTANGWINLRYIRRTGE